VYDAISQMDVRRNFIKHQKILSDEDILNGFDKVKNVKHVVQGDDNEQ
jgi:hypothetical protein